MIKDGDIIIALPPIDETQIYSFVKEKFPIYTILIDFINYPLSQWDASKSLEEMPLREKCLHELILGFFELPVSELHIKMKKDKENKQVIRIITLFHEHIEELLKQYDKEEIESISEKTLNITEKKSFIFVELEQLQKRIIYFTESCFINKQFHPNFGGIKASDIGYSVFFSAIYGDQGECYKIENIEIFCLFTMVKLLNSRRTINKCENCYDYFVPLTKNDEIYCYRIFSDGKTCKQIGYENKVKKDEALKEYRKVYKNKNAIKHRTKNNNLHAEKDFSDWAKEAKSKFSEYKDKNLTSDEFIEWLRKN